MRSKNQPGLWLAAFALLALGGLARAAEPVAVEWRWAKGQVLRYRVTQERRQTSTGLRSSEITERQRQVIRVEVTDVGADGAARVAATYEAVAVEMQQPILGKASWDSTRAADRERADPPPLAGFVGATVRWRIDRAGRVSEVAGFEAIVERATARLRGSAANAALIASFERASRDEAMQRQLEAWLRVVPEGPVRPGERWRVALEPEVPLLGTLRIETLYALDALDPAAATPTARISSTSTMTLVTPPKPDPATPQVSLRGERSSGAVQFDVSRGRLDGSVTTLVMDLEVEVARRSGEEAPRDAGPERVQLHVEQTTTLERLGPDEKPF